jgi:adenosylcobinamide kinase/adenosylcobinamide-phosphate guanylyltransferase
VNKKLTLILGGARSGKSSYAQALAEQNPGKVLYVATATAGDEEMAQRITAHRLSRPAHWGTLEAPLQVGAAVQAWSEPPDLVVLDCLTLLANNVLFSLPEEVCEADYQAALDAEVRGIVSAWQNGQADWIIVSNEVGLGLVPPYPMGRMYRDVLGKANQRLAQAATQVLFMVAGLPMTVK